MIRLERRLSLLIRQRARLFQGRRWKNGKEKRNYPAAPHLPCQRPDLDESGYFAGFILAAALLWI